MKVFALSPLAALLLTVAVAFGEELEISSDITPGPSGAEISVSSGNNLPSNNYPISAGNSSFDNVLSISVKSDESENGPSVSYGGFGSPDDNEPNEQSDETLSVEYGSKNQTDYSNGRSQHQHGQRVHNHEHGSYPHGGHSSRHKFHRASSNGSHSQGGHSSRRKSRGSSSHVSHNGSRHDGYEGSSSGRLSGALGNNAKNISGLSASLNLGNVAKNVRDLSGSLNVGNIAKNVPSIPFGLPGFGNISKNIPVGPPGSDL